MKQKKLMEKERTGLEDATNRRSSKARIAGIFLMTVFVSSTASVFAAGDFFSDLGSSFESVYLALVALSPVVGLTAFVAAKLWQMAMPDKQSRMEPKDWARSVLYNYFCILAAGGFFGFIAKVAGNIN